MKYLFIDTSTSKLTIALSSDTNVLSMKSLTSINGHSRYAMSEIQEAFNEASLKPNDIDKIIVVNGPGSFTGVRIGVTIAKTYAWALKKDVIPVSSLFINALGYNGYDYYISVIDARRNHVYAAIYDNKYNTFLNEQYISIFELNDIIKSLKGSFIVIGDIDIEDYKSNPINIDILKIINNCKNKESVSAHSLVPNYLKRVEAEEKLMVVEK
jgi:tRNA threonylcarbamoyladenosine biosynthesis protein TsaB